MLELQSKSSVLNSLKKIFNKKNDVASRLRFYSNTYKQSLE